MMSVLSPRVWLQNTELLQNWGQVSPIDVTQDSDRKHKQRKTPKDR